MSDAISRLNAALEGRYAIERELGEGGMATVYLADDLKHERKVALKVLKPELAAVVGAERFLAEIKTTANLTHPHILPLFDSGEADSFLFYVMPHIEGESLRERIDREKQLPVDEAVKIATDLAEALDYAHRHKVIHRDIKPANILIHEGRPLIADFGIALAVGVAGGGRLTETGLSVGTPHYMSPEQATGDQAVGAATDIYALGAVLYEMLIGDPPYMGSTAQAILGRIIAGKVASASEERASVPANVDAAIRKALEKLPADRFTRAQEFAGALADPGFRHGEVDEAAVVAGVSRPVRLAVGWTLLIGMGLGLGWWTRGKVPPTLPDLSFVIDLPMGSSIAPSDLSPIALSPDGTRLVYTGQSGGRTQLYRRELGAFDVVPIPGTEGAMGPFFSPDGEWLGFFADGELRKIPVSGGVAVRLADAALARGAVWTPGDTIIFTAVPGSGLWGVDINGGDPWPVTMLDASRGERTHRLPDLLSDDGSVLFTARTGSHASFDAATIDRVSLEDGTRSQVFAGGSQARLLGTGHLVFVRGGQLHAVAIDPVRMVSRGPALAVVDSVMTDPSTGAAHYAVSETGVLAYVRGGAWTPSRELRLVGENAGSRPMAITGRPFRSPRFSPDGNRVAVVIEAASDDIWIYEFDGTSDRLTFEAGSNVSPVWNPDGSQVAFASNRGGRYNLFMIAVNGPRQVRPLTTSEEIQFPTSWHPDGSVIAFTQNSLTGSDIWTIRVEGGSPEPFLDDPHNEYGGVFSPDGNWLAYVSDENGIDDVFVRRYPSGEERRQISSGGGVHPLWASDSSQLFYLRERDIMAVSVRTTPDFRFATPQQYLRIPAEGATIAGIPNFDLDRRQNMFVIVEEGATRPPTRIHVVFNFFEELRERMGN